MGRATNQTLTDDSRETFEHLLFLYDRALLAGQVTAETRQSWSATDATPHWQDAVDCLDLLKRVWPGTTSVAPLVPHQQIGRFLLDGELGQGATSVVHRAVDPLLNRTVAVKVPRPHTISTPDLRHRFLKDGVAAATLNHPHIIRVLEAGETGPLCYLVCEFCPGPSLAGYLREHAMLVPPRRAALWIAQLAGAVQHAHEHGVLHRDIKPGNVLLAAAPGAEHLAKLTDFGLAKLAGEGETQTGAILGTPAYMSPEQARGEVRRIGPASDVYSLGAVLYELLTGRVPFRSESDLDLLRQVVHDEPVACRKLQPSLPRDLETVCLKCLAKDPQQRYRRAGDLADDLQRFLAGEPIHARPAGIAERSVKWIRRHPARAVASAAVLLTLLAAVGGLVAHSLIVQEKNLRLNQALDEKLRARYADATRDAQQRIDLGQPYDAEEVLTGIAGDTSLSPLREFAWRHLHSRLPFEPFTTEERRPPRPRAVCFIGGEKELFVSSGDSGSADLWDLANGRHIRSFEPVDGTPRFDVLAVSPDGTEFAVGDSDARLQRWNIPSGKRLGSALLPRPAINIAFAPDGKSVLSIDRGDDVLQWNFDDNNVQPSAMSHPHQISMIRSCPGRNLVILGGVEGGVSLWDFPTQRKVHEFSGHEWDITHLTISADESTLASAAIRDGFAQVYDLGTRERRTILPLQPGLSDIEISRDGTRLLTEWEQGAAVWDVAGSTPRPLAASGQNSIYAADLAPDGETAVVIADGKLWKWPIHANHPARIAGHAAEAWSVAFHPTRPVLATGGDDQTIRLWDLKTGHEQRVLRGPFATIASVAISNDGKRIAGASLDGTLQLWDLDSPGPGRTVPVDEPARGRSLELSQTVPAGDGPKHLVLRDLNRDRHPDLAVVNFHGNSITVYLNDGRGGLLRKSELRVGGRPNGIAAADVNGDKDVDLVVANGFNNSVGLLLGKGDGTFLAEQAYAAGSSPMAVATDDLDGDGKPDLVVSNDGGERLSVLLNRPPDGESDRTDPAGFLRCQGISVGQDPYGSAVADLNGDKHLDFVVTVTGEDRLVVCLGRGDGTFDPAQGYATRSRPRHVALGDLDRDGMLDAVVAHREDKSLSVLFGAGDGTFRPAPHVELDGHPDHVCLAHVDADGFLDAITANQAENSLTVLFGGGRAFSATLSLPTDVAPRFVIAEDLNGDARADVLCVNSRSNTLNVFLGTGNRQFQPQPAIGTGAGPNSALLLPAGADGRRDLVVACVNSGSLEVLRGDGRGHFDTISPVPATSSFLVSLKQNSPLDPFLATVDLEARKVWLLRALGDSRFEARSVDVPEGPHFLSRGDFNEDGSDDLLLSHHGTNQAGLLIRSGPQVSRHPLSLRPQLLVGKAPQALVVTDLDADGLSDLVSANTEDSSLTVSWAEGDETWRPATLEVSRNPRGLVQGDFTGDGRPDLAVVCADGNVLRVLKNTDHRQFESLPPVLTPSRPWGLATADYDRDGRLDLVTTQRDGNSIALFLGRGDGTFQEPLTFEAGKDPVAVCAGDLNGDGRMDLVTANFEADTLSVLFGAGEGEFPANRKRTRTVAFSPDNRQLATGSYDGSVRVWDCDTLRLAGTLPGHTDTVRKAGWSPDGRWFVSACHDGRVLVRSTAPAVEDWKLVREIQDDHEVRAAVFSPDSRTLAIANKDGQIALWDMHTRRELWKVQGHRAGIRALAWSPDGRTLASGAEDHAVRLWESSSGTELCTLTGHKAEVNDLAFSPDGTHLASVSHDGAVLLWSAGE